MSQHVPKELDHRLPAEIDRQVRTALPELFDGTHRTVLYVGASRLRRHFLAEFIEAYDIITILELFEGNVAYLWEKYRDPGIRVIHDDVRRADEIFTERFDVIFFWHGHEHLQEREVCDVLGRLEAMANLVVLGMPYGHYPQGPEYGNMHEAHLWHIYPKDIERYGYTVDTLGRPDDTLANMMAWKRTG